VGSNDGLWMFCERLYWDVWDMTQVMYTHKKDERMLDLDDESLFHGMIDIGDGHLVEDADA